jgi:crotonobetainyl-CoA:carnitine CoA-transferase CaiB-like acyl-CoA transferase
VGALDGVRILDLSWGVAGPLGVLLLAEQGADTIKVEPPGGDPFRAYDGYRVWNRSRRSVTLDLTSDAGQDALAALVRTADVVVESYRPGVKERLGFGWERVHELNSRTVLLSLAGYPEGHRWAGRPGYDALVQAASGQQWSQPGWRAGPIFLHMPMPSMGALFLVASGATAALVARERTGEGQHVRTSLLQGALLYTTQIWQYGSAAPGSYHEMMSKSYPPGIHQQMIFECANGQWLHWSVMSGLTPTKSIDDVLGLEDAPDPFTFMVMPAEEREQVNQARRKKFLEWDRDALTAELRAHNHAAEPIIPMDEAYAHEQLIANGMVATVDDPTVGTTTQIGVPIHMLGTPGAIVGPQPQPGEHNDDILGGELGLDAAQIAAATGDATRSVRAGRTTGINRITDRPAPAIARSEGRGPLDGIRLLDFGQYLAGPFGPMVLGDLGAEVIKIEPVTGDGMRMSSKPFVGCQRGKRSLALDIKAPGGLDVARRLIATADVVHHNMTKGVAARLGIDYESCRAIRPDLVYCNTYAYGLEGPLSHFGGLDPLYQAAMGLEYEAGATHAGNTPLYYRFGMCDTGNAMLSVVGVLLALYRRARTGDGQELWTSLHDAGAVFSSDAHLVDGTPWDRPRLDADLMGLGATYRLYRTQDGWLQVAAVTDADRAALCNALALPDAADDSELAEQLEAVLATRTSGHWQRLLDDAGVPVEAPVEDDEGQRFLFDADAERLGLIAQYEHPILGSMRQFGALVDFSETPKLADRPPPLTGQHTREILAEVGFADTEIDALHEQQVVTSPDGDYPFPI